MYKLFCIIVFSHFICISTLNAKYVTIECKSGDGIYSLLQSYLLELNSDNINQFKEINKGKIKKNNGLYAGFKYSLPIDIQRFNGKSIRSSLGIDDLQLAIKIQEYNNKIFSAGIVKKSYKQTKILYVPASMSSSESPALSTDVSTITCPKTNNIQDLFGKQYSKIAPIDNAMRGHVFYLSPGHGGPDPGAIGESGDKKLCEDEYAYDITLRLARNLLEHNATVYMIVQDLDDGIRESNFLNCDSDEILFGGDTISNNQTQRLLKRAEIMNDLYEVHKINSTSQTALMIHVDSRYQEQRIDIFYYYNKGNAKGRKLAKTIYNTIKEKYAQNQPGRGYYGTISTRNLLELRKTNATGVYIELGNIQNPNDQIRFIDPNNRQAIANWLYLGLKNGTK